ncbi:hypothetical protein [Pantoea cypripedii]|uniref:Uncharacterized protein n=1 Tax=Pantoea cypripedii TaxID=55209 RepID=A0A6B9GGB8_PANCY|nr:hypothetical protein [Pantoea cypripedii]QGY32909.1 hypothetical protein CUN67_28660 [Pantoea cypripedii]
MVKPRTREFGNAAANADPELEKKIQAFADGADLNPGEKTKPEELNKNAKRGYKNIRVPFNEYEYQVLEKLSKHEGRSMLNMLRQAILREAEKAGLI